MATARPPGAPPVVLVHAGVCDNRMWDPLEEALGGRLDLVRHELRGYGDTPLPASGTFSHAGDLEQALSGPAVLVGASFGGQVCLELAARRPDLVVALLLLNAALPDHEWSQEVLDYAVEEERLLDAGDLDGVAELNAAFWALPDARGRVREMQRHALDLQSASDADDIEPEHIDLSAVTAPTLVAWGELDHADFHRIGERLVAELPNAAGATIEGAGHLPALERPEQTARMLLELLDPGA
jgi:3-oxoadipate enol-lactonase